MSVQPAIIPKTVRNENNRQINQPTEWCDQTSLGQKNAAKRAKKTKLTTKKQQKGRSEKRGLENPPSIELDLEETAVSAKVQNLKYKTQQKKSCFSVFSRRTQLKPFEEKITQAQTHTKNQTKSSSYNLNESILSKSYIKTQMSIKNKFFSPSETQKKYLKRFQTVDYAGAPGKALDSSNLIPQNNEIRGQILGFTRQLSSVYKKEEEDGEADSGSREDNGGSSGGSSLGEDKELAVSVNASEYYSTFTSSSDENLSCFRIGSSEARALQVERRRNFGEEENESEDSELCLSGEIRRVSSQNIDFFSKDSESWPSIEENSAPRNEGSGNRDHKVEGSEMGFSSFCLKNYPMCRTLSHGMLKKVERAITFVVENSIEYLKFDQLVSIFFPDGKKPNFGEYVEMKELEAVLQQIAEHGARHTSLSHIETDEGHNF